MSKQHNRRAKLMYGGIQLPVVSAPNKPMTQTVRDKAPAPGVSPVLTALMELDKRIIILHESLEQLSSRLSFVSKGERKESFKLKLLDAAKLFSSLVLLQENIEMLVNFTNTTMSELEI